jgi:hypothetical protein
MAKTPKNRQKSEREWTLEILCGGFCDAESGVPPNGWHGWHDVSEHGYAQMMKDRGARSGYFRVIDFGTVLEQTPMLPRTYDECIETIVHMSPSDSPMIDPGWYMRRYIRLKHASGNVLPLDLI